MAKSFKNGKTHTAILEAKTLFADQLCQNLSREHGVELGRFEAEEIFDSAFHLVAPVLYNQGLRDAKIFLQDRFLNLSEDVTQLEISAETR
ncbi:MAG TPA: DUF2164 family protein [Fibrobacteraceae bacterium]|nr:DUF2164 family protein [Fibrobacteraceae bacterium]